MKIDRALIKALLLELIDENPLACRAVFSITGLAFSAEIETLCVTLGKPSRLMVNEAFVRDHCRTECHVKALLLHEFLHLLLRHTTRYDRMTPALNVALDAVINAVIHRRLGDAYSGMMAEYYGRAPGVLRWLRPPTAAESSRLTELCGMNHHSDADREELLLLETHHAIYGDRLVADDVLELCRRIRSDEVEKLLKKGFALLGGHQHAGRDLLDDLEPEVAARVRQSLGAMPGGSFWSDAPERRAGVRDKKIHARPVIPPSWREMVAPLIKRLMNHRDPGGPVVARPASCYLPVLNSHDRRGWLRALWNPVIAENEWHGFRNHRQGRVHVYLDASGSMDAAMGLVVRLLWEFHDCIQSPFWAFSGVVEPAVIRQGRLETVSNGVTSFGAVLRHIVATRPEKALVVTDGFTGAVNSHLIRSASFCRIETLITPDGSPDRLRQAGLPVTCLPKPAPGCFSLHGGR